MDKVNKCNNFFSSYFTNTKGLNDPKLLIVFGLIVIWWCNALLLFKKNWSNSRPGETYPYGVDLISNALPQSVRVILIFQMTSNNLVPLFMLSIFSFWSHNVFIFQFWSILDMDWVFHSFINALCQISKSSLVSVKVSDRCFKCNNKVFFEGAPPVNG